MYMYVHVHIQYYNIPYLCNSGISVPGQYEVEGILPSHGGLYPQEGMGCLLNTHSTTKIIILKEATKKTTHL